jgi:excisionase family DNA binding protein
MRANHESERTSRPSPKRSDVEVQTYTLAEFARKIGVSYTTLHELCLRGEAPVTPIRAGRQWKFPKSAVHRLLDVESSAPA